MRTRAVCCAWSDVGSPGSRTTSFHTCQVLRPRRVVWTLAFTPPHVLPSAFATASAPGIRIFARLNGWRVLLYRRFAAALTGGCARLEVDVVSYSLIVSDLHRLLVAGLPAHCERVWTLPGPGVAPQHDLKQFRELGAPVVSSIPAQLPGHEPASANGIMAQCRRSFLFHAHAPGALPWYKLSMLQIS